jgi:hypothetical protein
MDFHEEEHFLHHGGVYFLEITYVASGSQDIGYPPLDRQKT